MATTHRILEEFCEESYSLYALHSSLEDFAVVYALNKYLKTRFKRLRTDLDIAKGLSFPIFEWMDVSNERYWTLICNYNKKEEKGSGNDLFMDEPSITTYHLIPEYREVDYFLKIEGDTMEEEEYFLRTLAGIPKMITAYAVDTNKLKSKKNLIF